MSKSFSHCRTFNDACAAAYRKYPRRFLGTITLPMQAPKLAVVLPHASGSFPWLIGRRDNGVARRKELKHMKQPASSYLRRFYYDTISHHPQIMRFLIEMVGIDRIVIGSDYNMDAGYPRPVEFLNTIPGLTAQERELILSGNAARVLKIA